MLIAIVLQETGRRAGLPIGIVAGERGHFLAHQRLTEPRVLDPQTGRLTDADTLGTLRWHCGHQLAAALLDLLQPRYERSGDLRARCRSRSCGRRCRSRTWPRPSSACTASPPA